MKPHPSSLFFDRLPVSRSKALPDCGQTRQPSLSFPHSSGADMKGLCGGCMLGQTKRLSSHVLHTRPASHLFPAVQYTAPSSSATSRSARPSVPAFRCCLYGYVTSSSVDHSRSSTHPPSKHCNLLTGIRSPGAISVALRRGTHSFCSVWHVSTHTLKSPRFHRLQLIYTYLLRDGELADAPVFLRPRHGQAVPHTRQGPESVHRVDVCSRPHNPSRCSLALTWWRQSAPSSG